MKLLSGLVGEIGSVISTLSVSSKEKKQIEADLIAAVCRQEEELSRSRSAIIRAEAGEIGCSVRGGLSLCLFLRLSYWSVLFRSSDIGRYFPVLGFAGNRYRRLRRWAEC